MRILTKINYGTAETSRPLANVGVESGVLKTLDTKMFVKVIEDFAPWQIILR